MTWTGWVTWTGWGDMDWMSDMDFMVCSVMMCLSMDGFWTGWVHNFEKCHANLVVGILKFKRKLPATWLTELIFCRISYRNFEIKKFDIHNILNDND